MNWKKLFLLLNPGSVWDIASRLFSITFLVGLCLAGVYALTSPLISAHEEETRQSSMSAFFPGCHFTQVTCDSSEVERVYLAEQASQYFGYCILLSTNGYGGSMEVMVATEVNGTVLGVKVLNHSETQNIGSVAAEDTFLSQFKGKTEGVTLVQAPNRASGNEIQAVSGATRSSKAVTLAVTNALAAVADLTFEPPVTEEDASLKLETAALKNWFGEAIARPISLPGEHGSVVEIAEMRTATALVGYAVKAQTVGQNEAFKITTLIGYDAAGAVISYEILESFELESFTAALRRDDFRLQFTGRTAPVTTDGGENSVQLIANMEKSCRAIVKAVNDGLQTVAALKGGAAQ